MDKVSIAFDVNRFKEGEFERRGAPSVKVSSGWEVVCSALGYVTVAD